MALSFNNNSRLATAPTMAEIRLHLGDEEQEIGLDAGATAWLSSGIRIQETQ